MNYQFNKGIKAGIPICLGYFSVSFGVGILAVQNGIPVWAAVVISLTNLTSAGEAAGIAVIGAAGSYLEMVLTQLLINCRYVLMALALSQKLAKNFSFPKRLAVSYGITDEIFGVASAQEEALTASYMGGLIGIATFGWVLGTFLGAVCGEILPQILVSALGILLYGMFIAVIIPPIRKSLSVLAAVLIAAGISTVIYFGFPWISGGFAVIISAMIAAVIMAILAPVTEEKEDEL